MLTTPNQSPKLVNSYFSFFDGHCLGWAMASLGFYLITFVESVGNRLYAPTPTGVVPALALSAAGSILSSLLNAFIFGVLWMHLGSVLLGGREPVASTVKVVGGAFFATGILGLATVPLMVLSTYPGASEFFFLAAFAIQLVAGFSALALAIVGVRWLNHFTWRRSLAVLAWGPLLLVAIGLVAYLLRSL